MITPIIIPIATGAPKCPACNKDEEIIEVCNHCGHKYEVKPNKFLAIWLFGFIPAVILGVMFLAEQIAVFEKVSIIDYIFGVAFGLIIYVAGSMIIVGFIKLIVYTIDAFKKSN